MFNRHKMRKRKLYSVTEKLVAIVSVKRCESRDNVSRDNGVPESTIRRWLRDDEKLRDSVDYGRLNWSDENKNKRQNCAKDPQLEKVVFAWFAKEITSLDSSTEARMSPSVNLQWNNLSVNLKYRINVQLVSHIVAARSCVKNKRSLTDQYRSYLFPRMNT